VKSKHAIVVFGLSLVGISCLPADNPTAPSAPVPQAAGKDPVTTAATQQTVNGYVVHYDGRSVSDGNTTFSYTVTGTAQAQQLTHFAIEVPPCAPAIVGATPNGTTVGFDPATGLTGIKWAQSLGSAESRTYTTTYLGDVPEGVVRVGIKVGSTAELGVLPGPCQGFVVAGTVFVDPDANGSRGLTDEPGIIANVTVTLTGGLHGVETAVTDINGHYSFTVLAGSYTVSVAGATPAADFNEDLTASFTSTNPTTQNVSVGPDVVDLDFGYKPNTNKIIADFDLGVLQSTGRDRKYWTRVVRTVSRGGTLDNYDATAVLGLLTQIEGAFFPDPYQFTDGNELTEALAILTDNSRGLLPQLYRELFVSELNDAAGFGLVGEADLQDVLLSWGESILVDGLGFGKSSSVRQAALPDTEIESAIVVFISLNQRGGGDIPD
jgi:hypothetical protein